jgi:hypothetical protein
MAGVFTSLFFQRRVQRAPLSARNIALRRRIRRASVPCFAFTAAAVLTGCNESAAPAPTTDTPAPPAAAAPVSALIEDGSGQQTGWREFQYDSGGKLARVVTYDGPGADALWETDDDSVGYWSACAFTGMGWPRRNLAIEYSSAPLAAATRAAWEPLAPREVQCQWGMQLNDLHFEEVAEDIYVDAGADLDWFTGDDVPDVYRYTARQGITPTSSFAWDPTGAAGTAGSRAFWYTPGTSFPIKVNEHSNGVEELEAWFVWGSGLNSTQYTLRDAGGDNVLNNADDTIYLKVTWLFSADGSTTYRHFDGAGNETGYLREKRAGTEITSRLESVTTATGAGPDGVWRTDDDVRTVLRYRY